ncbi:MAG: AAA family ATPase [Patiriisocius sp.]|uniref:AAA family ATPase n=1 Tax=Patiriisocius sp. TaxID=2822396 RepID=UPI003EF527C3
MSIYQEILQWSVGKSSFTQDALRRIITSQSISISDIGELTQLHKKDEGDDTVTLVAVPLNNTHIPTASTTSIDYPKLISIKNPINISALHNEADLQFANTGLIVIYGNNGSGKSSYSRILKKLCWSRDKGIELKKNVFKVSEDQQEVLITIEENGTNQDFQWDESLPSHPALNSIFVFDSECGNIYVNNENPTEYKPTGIDVLERLIDVYSQISLKFDEEIQSYNTQKPIIRIDLQSTPAGIWYETVQSKTRVEVDNYILFSDEDKERKEELTELLKTQDPQEKIKLLRELKARVENYLQQFQNIEEVYNVESLQTIKDLRTLFEFKKAAYDLATNEIGAVNTLSGFGSDHWSILWNSAKNFAIKENLTDDHVFPSSESLEKCVLCQQDLNEEAQSRLEKFNEFVLNDVSTQLNTVRRQIEARLKSIQNTSVAPLSNYSDLTQYINEFDKHYKEFDELFLEIQTSLIEFLKSGGDLVIPENIISNKIEELIEKIDKKIKSNIEFSQNRLKFVAEFNNLLTKELLFNQKETILQYYDEYHYKQWLSTCKSKLITTQISKKIGDLMATQAVALQHQEFISHLFDFNTDLATKVGINKTRTDSGTTYQKCSFSDIGEGMNSVLSEGEQKIVALSNFLAECTIDNRKNTIVFDDPVNSLDMDYRDLISDKIIGLSSDRQIIVLTHDLSFLRLLIDTHKNKLNTDCEVIGITKYNEISGIVSDEIPYLAKNVDERIATIRRILMDHNSLQISDVHNREIKLEVARKRFRMLLEKTVEEVLSNKAYQRFSKNINFKKGNLYSYAVTEISDIDYLLSLYSKYSVPQHDGGTTAIPLMPSSQIIDQDITEYIAWKTDFKNRRKTLIDSN